MPHILVVDDSIVDMKLASGLLLKDSSWTLATAADGVEAIEQIESELPDLVVTDLQMPNMNGLELVEVIRNEYPLIPVILMTAAGSEAIAVEALEKGAASYVPKSQLATELVETAQRILSSSQLQRDQRRLFNYMSEVTYVIENDLKLVSALVAEIRSMLAERWLFDENEVLRIASAIDESLANAYYHGNLEVSSELREGDPNAYHELADQRRVVEPYSSRRINVRLRFRRDLFEITVHDQGVGFDPETLPDPTDLANLQKASGRGVLLMRSFMDDVIFSDEGRCVTMRKSLAHVRGDRMLDEDHVLGDE